jgi:hypothetical protein
MAGLGIRRTGAFLVILALMAAVFVVTAPDAFSRLATVQVSACEDDTALVSVTVDDYYAVNVVDDDGVAYYFGAPGASHRFVAGSYTWVTFAYDDESKTPLDEGSFIIDCSEETTTTTVPEETTTTVPEETTTTVPEETTTTVPEETTTTVACAARVGDVVWLDTDADGVQDAGEPAVAGVNVRLLDQSGAVVASTVTDTGGRYVFAGLCDGVYVIIFTLPDLPDYVSEAWTITGQGAGETDSDAGAQGRTVEINVVDGTSDMSWDAGIVVAQVSPTTTPSTAPPQETSITTVPTVTASTLPFTGGDLATVSFVGLGALLLGGGLLAVGTRKGSGTEPGDVLGTW